MNYSKYRTTAVWDKVSVEGLRILDLHHNQQNLRQQRGPPTNELFKRRTEGAFMTFCSSFGRGTASFERQWTTPGHTHCTCWQIANEKNLSHIVWSGRSTVVKHFIKSLLFGFIHSLGWKHTNKHARNPTPHN